MSLTTLVTFVPLIRGITSVCKVYIATATLHMEPATFYLLFQVSF